MSNRACPACTSSLFLTCTLRTWPATSAATGTTKAWTLAWDVCGVRRSETKYQVRLKTISTSTMIAPTREPPPGLGGGCCGATAAIGSAGATAGDDGVGSFGTGAADSWLMVLPLRKKWEGHRAAAAAQPGCLSSRCDAPWFRASRHRRPGG